VKSRRDGDKKGTAQVDVERGSKKTVAVDYDAAVRQIWNNNRASFPLLDNVASVSAPG
jgi:hypothetical protein